MYNDYVNVNEFLKGLEVREEGASYNFNNDDVYYNEAITNYDEIEL